MILSEDDLPGQVNFNVTCPERKSLFPRLVDETFLSPANKIWILFPNNSLYLINYLKKMVVMMIVNVGQYQEKASSYMLFSSSTLVSVVII